MTEAKRRDFEAKREYQKEVTAQQAKEKQMQIE
jgi:hypothetical protein